MKPVSDVTAMVVDRGLFIPLARCLAQKCKRVLFYNPERRQFPSVYQGSIGDGFPDIEHSDSLWKKKGEVDLFVFGDVGLSDEQHELRSQGLAVWGSGEADQLEQNRELFHKLLKRFGLHVPPHVIITGLSNLAAHLRDKTDKIIKISKWRGDLETQQWRNWAVDSGWVYEQFVRFGPLGEKMRFIVCDKIDTPLEIGGDTFNVNTHWPKLMLNGLEHKDTSYFGVVTKTDEMPPMVQEIMQEFAPRFKGVSTQWSMEVRVKDDAGYFIDPTPRGGWPSTPSQCVNWLNFPDIIWHGANGELVEPVPKEDFTMECAITAKCSDGWTVVELPDELEGIAHFFNCLMVDGLYCFPPNENMSSILGWLCVTGDSPKHTLELAKALCDYLPEGLDANVENMVGLIKEVDEAHEQGIEITDQPMPEPAEVVSD